MSKLVHYENRKSKYNIFKKKYYLLFGGEWDKF